MAARFRVPDHFAMYRMSGDFLPKQILKVFRDKSIENGSVSVCSFDCDFLGEGVARRRKEERDFELRIFFYLSTDWR